METLISGISSMFANPLILVLLILGNMLGLVVGALPGLNSAITMSVLIPVTFGMDPKVAFAMLAGIYEGATCGGSVTAILLKVPGTGAAVVTAFDGHEMFKKGQGGLALGISTVSSMFGGIISALVLCFFAPFLAEQALKFGPPEYFMLAFMGLCSVIGMSDKNIAKNVLSMAIGLFISMVGISPQGGVQRFTFGSLTLLSGISLVPMMIGLFGVGSIFEMLEAMGGTEQVKETIEKIKMKFPDRKMMKTILPIWMQSTIIGNIVGVVPGAGMTVAIFMAYDQAKRSNPKLPFGTGIPEGVAAPECANNSVVGSSMVPLLSLGIPGNAASAVFLGALLIHGIHTGPSLFKENADSANVLIVSFLISSILLLPLMFAFCNYMAGYVLRLKREVLSGLILILCVTGTFACNNQTGDVAITIVFGVIGYILAKFKIPMAPLILAAVLGSMIESYWLQSLVLANGNFSLFVTRPISCFLLILSAIFLIVPIWKKVTDKMKTKVQPAQ